MRHSVELSLSRTALFLLLCLPIAGCSSGGLVAGLKQPDPAKEFFAIEPGPPMATAPAATTPVRRQWAALLVRPLRVSPPYDGLAFVYRIGPSQYSSDYYSNFIANPGSLLSGALVDWLSRALPIPVASTSGPLRSDLVLDGAVTQLVVDFTDHAHPRAIVSAHFFLTKAMADGTAVLMDRTYEKSAPVSADTPAACAAAWGQAYRQVLGKLVVDVSAALR